MEISDFCKYAEKTEKQALKMQVTSVSEELRSRLSSDVIDIKTSTSKHLSESDTSVVNQPMESTPKESVGTNFDPSQAPQKKAKLLRIERKQNKLLAQGKTMEEINALMKKNKPQNTEKTLEDYFSEISQCSNKLEVFI